MTIATKREKLHDYINIADDKKVETIYTIVEGGIIDHTDLWEDEAFLDELDRRMEELESGKVKGISLDDLKAHNFKLELMKQASTDPLFLADMEEIKNDFQAVDNKDI